MSQQQDARISGLEMALRQWAADRDRVAATRDYLVHDAIDAGIAKNRIHALSGIARSTIDDILAAGSSEFAYITNPAARAWAEANAEAITRLTADVTKVIGTHRREALAVAAWVAATGRPGNAEEQMREIHFQMMAASTAPYRREASEALDRALGAHLPLPAAPSTETTEQKP